MERRSFLGFMGGAVASVPAMAKVAAQSLTMKDLTLPGVVPKGLGWFNEDPPEEYSSLGIPQAVPGESRTKMWAWRSLRALKKMNPWTRAFRERSFRMDGLDPNTASLRSVALSQKIRISRRIQVDEAILLERQKYHAQIRGWIE